jgi:DNA-binding LacI/PurR family transcriptional regulator
MKKISIKDVAEHAGVSTATVSHVINETRFVSEDTKQRVIQAIEELGYFPSAVARGLASRKSKIVGVVFSDISNPFFTSVYKGIESLLTEQGYELTLANTGEVNATQEVVLNTMFSRQIDGLIISPTGEESPMLNRIISSHIPVIMLDRGGPFPTSSMVRLDNVTAAYDATSHLIEDGHKKIGIVLGLSSVDTTSARLEGYKNALASHQLPFKDSYVIEGQSQSKGGLESTRILLTQPDPPTAVFTTNNLMTLGALHAIRDLGLRIPKDIGLVGFDDHDWADIFTPPITVVKQPTFKMGVEAAKLLAVRMKAKQGEIQKETMIFRGELIVRCSCSEHCDTLFPKNKTSATS